MRRRRATLAALASLIVYAGSSCIDLAAASTLCESSGNSSSATSAPAAPAASAVNPSLAVQKTPLAKKPAAHSSNRDNTVVAAGGSSPAPGDDDAAANLGTPGASVHRHGLRWQSLLPGVIK
ncbi:MAG: hypothetical protein ACREPT_03860 [Rudaea sp.]